MHVYEHPPRRARAPAAWSTGCAFGDYDGDALDLFVSRYVKLDLANLPEFGKGKTCEYRGVAASAACRGEGDLLFYEGKGKFSEVGAAASP